MKMASPADPKEQPAMENAADDSSENNNDTEQENAPAPEPEAQPEAAAAAENDRIPTGEVEHVWGDLTETQEDRMRNEVTLDTMNGVVVKRHSSYSDTCLLGKKPRK
eukprot:TRINITY_DN18430_c0_g1_i1.p1 TRINITY_DN18430_c0_g1~~TRINITY_DN18430_c0_g1_i1.p1  ORF type:complete len:107 (-),score=33.79 TRINITY_DN18430_c0_g1_i1:353-673(-)